VQLLGQLLGQLLERLQGQRQRVQRQEPVQLLEPQQALGQPGQRLLFLPQAARAAAAMMADRTRDLFILIFLLW